MTLAKNVPYLYCELKPAPFYSSEYKNRYQWTVKESSKAREYSYYLLKNLNQRWQHDNPYKQTIEQLLSNHQNRGEEESKDFHYHKTHFKISLEIFDAFNGIGTWRDLNFALAHLFVDIYQRILQQYYVGINFREVFLLQKDEVPPSHFRPGIDICVTDITEYKQLTESFSYQLGIYVINKFKPDSPPSQQNLDLLNKTIIDHYSFIKNKQIDFTTPLKDFPYYKSALSALIDCFNRPYYMRSGSIPSVFSFSSVVSPAELEYFFREYSSLKQDLTLVFKGMQYEEESERQKIHQEILTLVKKLNCAFMVHIFLITRDNLEVGLLNLKAQSETEELFTPLRQGAGYYLSSTIILSVIYRKSQIQEEAGQSY